MLDEVTRREKLEVSDSEVEGEVVKYAERTGRTCRGMELDPLYVDTAIRRWQNLTGRDAVRISDGKLFRDIEAEKEQADEF